MSISKFDPDSIHLIFPILKTLCSLWKLLLKFTSPEQTITLSCQMLHARQTTQNENMLARLVA